MNQSTAIVTFRGGAVDVIYEDMGHEPDCNAHVIEWRFLLDPYNIIFRATDAEQQSIYDQLKDRVDATPDGWP